MRSFEDNNHPELENQKSTKNIVNSQPNFKNKKKSHKNRLPKIKRCFFTKKDIIILITRNIYKEFFANLKNIEVTTSEFVTNIRNEEMENENDNISNKEEEENNYNININSKNEEEKNYINNNCEETKINININNSNSNNNNTIEGNYYNSKDENINTNIKNTDNVEDEDNKLISKIKKKFNKKSKDIKEFSNSRENQNQSKSKIKIYKRENNNNNNNNNNSNNKSFKKDNKDNKDNLKESYNQKIPSNIKRVINSNSQIFNEEKKKDSKEIRILKFNKNKSLIKNKEINDKIRINNKNKKNQNKKALSINNTPKNILILKKNESNKNFKLKTSNDNDKKYQNKTSYIKAEKNYIISNNSNNKIKKKEGEKRKILILESKNSKQKVGSKNEKKNQLYPKNNINNININQKTFPISLEKNPINVANKILKKKINKNNKTIEEIKNNEKIKNKQKRIKKNYTIKNKLKEKELLTNKLNYTNRETTIINNKNENENKILSHRSFHNAKNLTKYKFPQVFINKNKKTFENNTNPNNYKLDLSNSGRRNKEKITLSKKSRFNALQNYMKAKRNKKLTKINNIFKENEKTKRNNITGSNINNNNNKINNDNTIFKTIEKQTIFHIKRIKKEGRNILSLAQFQIKENKKNNEDINDQKKYIKKLNNFHINRVKSSYFDKRTLPNFKDFETRINILKNKRSNSIFLYTRHYGNHNKCPLCQSMEMKAEFSKSKLGLYLKHIKNDNEESKLCSNYSSIRNNRFISSAKNIKNIKDSRNITFKKELSPINMNSTNDRYFLHSREQFVYNILKNKGKIDKLEINDFPVFNKYFNS